MATPLASSWLNPFGANVATSGINPGPGLMAPPPTTGTGLLGAPGTPQGDALTAFAGNLLAGSGWSPTRQTGSEVFGRALLAAQQARAASLDQIQKQKLAESQLQLQQAQLNNLQNPTTDDIREYQFAKNNGYTGTFDQWMVIKKMSGSTPAALQEWDYYNKLSPEDQKRFLELKRSQQTYALGEVAGAPGAFNRQTGGFTPLASTTQEAQGKGQVAGAVSAAQATGTAQAGAAFDLPRVKQNVTQAIDTIDKLIKAPGLGAITGLASKLPIIPGTDQANADALAKQVEGQTFLQAFQSLRGGGAITDVEGTKGTAAVARLQRSQTKEEYIQSLKDAREIFQIGLDRIAQQASGKPVPRETAPSKNSSGWSISPVQ